MVVAMLLGLIKNKNKLKNIINSVRRKKIIQENFRSLDHDAKKEKKN